MVCCEESWKIVERRWPANQGAVSIYTLAFGAELLQGLYICLDLRRWLNDLQCAWDQLATDSNQALLMRNDCLDDLLGNARSKTKE